MLVETKRYLNTDEALEHLGWGSRGKQRLYNLTAAEAIPFVKHGSRNYFDRLELDAYIDSCRRGRR